MPTMEELHERLDAVSARLDSARREIDFERALNDGHNLTSGELLARYRYLKDTLDGQIASLEAHDRHVSALEQDAMAWINSIDLTMS